MSIIEQDGKAKSELISLLEFEIRETKEDESKPGWSTWALIGALGGIVWIFLSDLEQRTDMNPEHSMFLFICLALSWEVLTEIPGWVFPWYQARNQLKRFWKSDSLLAGARLLILSQLIWYLLVIDFIIFLNADFQVLPLVFVLIFFGQYIAAIVGAFFVSFSSHEFSPQIGTQTIRSVIMFVRALFIIGTIILWFLLQNINWELYTIGDWRCAGLCFSASLILVRLVMLSVNNPLLKTLRDLRRKLILDQIGCPFAKKQLAIALNGMDVTDVLRQPLESILSKHRQIALIQTDILKDIEAFTDIVDDASPLSPAQRTVLDAVLTITEAKLAEANVLSDQVAQELKSLEEHIDRLSKLYPDVQAEMKQSLQELRKKLDALLPEIRAVTKKIHDRLAILRRKNLL